MGDVFSSPGCSVTSVSAGDPGGWALGGVDEAFRTSVDAPLPFTQDVSITLTPILPKTQGGSTISHPYHPKRQMQKKKKRF